MADKKRNGGSHAKPAEEKKKTGFRLGKGREKAPREEPGVYAQEPYEQPFTPEELPGDAGAMPDTGAMPEAALTPDEPPYEDEPAKKPGRAEAKRAEREAKRAEKEAEREAKKAQREAEKNDDSPERRDKRRKRNIALIVAGAVAVLVIAGATYGGYAVTESKLTLPNVYVGDVFIGSMTQEQVQAALEEQDWDGVASATLTVKLPAKINIELKRSQSGAVPTAEDALAEAERFGHDGSWYANLFKYIYNFFSATDLVEYYRAMDDEYIRTAVDKGVEEFYTATAESGYVIEEEKSMMYMIKGGGEMKFDLDALCTAVSEALIAGQKELQYTTFVSQPAMPDFNAIHKELEREPVDASYTETFEVVEDVVGCKFDVAEAESIWKDAVFGDSLEIPMDITFPKVTGEALKAQLYRDVLGEQITYFPNSVDNRINNLNLAVSKINGLILLPGETFSYNGTIGQRTEEAGFLPAGAYDDGEVVEQVGGGVCQVSSTLYSATLYAQMETVDRTCHFFAVDYLDKGMDATVSWPKPDFKFKNCREYPIKIVASCDNDARSLTVQIMGTDVDGSYVKIRRDTYTKFGEYGEAIGYSIFQYRDIYAADGTFLRTETYDYLDDYYFHEYKDITAKAKEAAEKAAAAAAAPTDTGAAGDADYGGEF